MGSRFLPPLAAFLFLGLSLSPALSLRVHAQTAAPLYLALGDSLTFGVGADDPATEGYVGLTAAALKDDDRFSESGIDLVNLGASGATSGDLLEADGQLQRALAEIQARVADGKQGNEAAIISLSIGGNDLLGLAAPESPCLTNASSDACQTALSQMLGDLQRNISEVLSQLRGAAPDAQIYVMNLYNPYSGSNDNREIIASIGVQQVNGVIGAAASVQEYNAKLVSVFELFQGRAKEWIALDGIHPNNDGYRVMAEALQAAIEGRAVSLPADLASPRASSDPAASAQSGDGVDTIVVLIALPAAFIAGAVLSGTYFVMRGRG